MAPPGRRPEEIYAHPPPFAPPFSPNEPIFPPAGQPLIPERIDDNMRGSKGLMYLTKMKGCCICVHVKAELLEPYPDLIEEYWKRDDVPHHERHPWGSKELIEGKKKYDAMLAEKKAADDEKKAALEGIESGQDEAEEEAGGQAQESDSDLSGDDDDA
ncbi:hypothetical protein DMC30DRAFT_414404 [Rhodotorula diobovata]|uniref:Uncharacterized protein n=1 Tax=Rhodotorula diobovata TaxID=5288 RepID=A0A5C5G424_9BASI|nr:hypothetical protein DMC30DRAFT_414404 [Rhodotorula diobovata]